MSFLPVAFDRGRPATRMARMDTEAREAPVVGFAAAPDEGVVEALVREGIPVTVAETSLGGDRLAAFAASVPILVVRSSQRIDEPVFRAGSAGRLRAIVQASAGLDNIDRTAARRYGVRVVPVDPGNAISVAELVIASLLALFRNLPDRWAETARGGWPDRERLPDREVHGKVLGLVGLGRTGGRVATRARALGMRVLAVDPYVPGDRFVRLGVERVAALREMLPRLDALSLHCPLTPETRGLIGAEELSLLPRGAVLVNAARGAIVDEGALRDALDRDHLRGAALDTWSEEPPPSGSLRDHPRVLPTPHAGGHTVESHARRARHVLRALLALARETGPGVP